VNAARPREVGRLWLRRVSRDWGHGGGPVQPRRKHSTLLVCVLDGDVHLSIGFEQVALSAAEREQFAEIYVRASHEADAVPGGSSDGQ
jgi:hypothetical protein